jgi:hypothetical protein
MLEKKSVFLSTVYVYLSTILLALVFMKVFREFYVWQFNPPKFSSIFSLWSNNFELNFTGFIYALIFFLPLSIFILMERKKLLIWLLGIFIPFLLIIAGGSKEIIWFLIFTVTGGLIGWLINIGIKKLKK